MKGLKGGEERERQKRDSEKRERGSRGREGHGKDQKSRRRALQGKGGITTKPERGGWGEETAERYRGGGQKSELRKSSGVVSNQKFMKSSEGQGEAKEEFRRKKRIGRKEAQERRRGRNSVTKGNRRDMKKESEELCVSWGKELRKKKGEGPRRHRRDGAIGEEQSPWPSEHRWYFFGKSWGGDKEGPRFKKEKKHKEREREENRPPRHDISLTKKRMRRNLVSS